MHPPAIWPPPSPAAAQAALLAQVLPSAASPPPTPIEELRTNPNYADGTWALVSVDESNLRVQIARVGITMPQRVLDAIDRHAKAHGETRSGLLARAAVRYIGREDGSMPEAKPGGANLRTRRAGASKAQKGR